jgi:Ca2+-binding RTX toxin-like protein
MSRRILGALTACLVCLPFTPSPNAGAAVAEVIRGTNKKDVLEGTNGDDRIRARDGYDQVTARKGNDVVFGGKGQDTIDGGQGEDELHGGAGDDVIDGATTDPGEDLYDQVWGDAGNDRIYVRYRDAAYGGDGRDRIEAVYPDVGTRIDCGPGHDVLIFNTTPSRAIRITGCEKVKVFSAG